MNNFNRELLMFFQTLLDGSKYIYIEQSLNRDDAQQYCAKNYENGTLCSFKDNEDWEHLTDSIRIRGSNVYYYWTGLKRRKQSGLTWYYEFSDGTSTKYAEGIIHEQNNVSAHYFSIGKNGKRWYDSERRNYFICQVNKGNKIYR